MNTRECCAACLHTDRSLPHLSLGSSQLKFVPPLRRRRRFPARRPRGGSCVQRGREIKTNENLYTVVGTHARERALSFFFPFFFGGGFKRLSQTVSPCGTQTTSVVWCVRGGEKNLSRSTRVLCTLFLPRASVLSCTLFLLFIVSKPPVSLFFFFLLAWARIVNIGFGEYEPPRARTKAIILRTAFIHRTVPECRCFTCKV